MTFKIEGNNKKNYVKTKRACLDKADSILRHHENKSFPITAPCIDYICLNRLIMSAQSSCDHFVGFETSRFWS